jgi:hypothetical protein
MLQVDLDGNQLSDINVQMPGITRFDPTWLNVPVVAAKVIELL